MTGVDPEYQYHLKDHLGNVRVTFTTKQDIEENTATLETANDATEESQFLYYDEAVKINSTLFDHTNNGATNYSTRLSGSPNELTGLAKSISVMPGDTIRTEVYAKYLDGNTSNWTTALTNFMAAIAGGTAPEGTFVDGGQAGSTGGTTPSFIGLLDKGDETGNAPKAYLNYLIFDKNYVLLNGGFVRMSESAREYGQDGAHEKLADEFVITEPGFVYIYLSNDNAALGGSQTEVYFDDFNVEHTKSSVIESNEYYPYGAIASTYSRESSLKNRFKYQSKELITDLGLEQYDFGPRQYDPWGVFTTTQDPHAENYYDKSPYSWVFGNPVRLTDPTGMDPEDPISIGSLLNKAVEAANTIVNFFFGGGDDGSAESASNMSEAHSTMQAVGVETQNMRTEIEGTLGQVPGLGSALSVTAAGQAETTGETMQHLGEAAVKANSIPVVGGKSGGGKYSNLPEPKTVSSGKKFTQAQKANMLEANRQANGGVLRSDLSGKKLDSPVQSKKGVKANMNQAEVDHVKAKSKGGTNSNSNAQVLSKQENLKKRDN